MHIVLDDALVAELDRRAGPRRRTAFVEAAIRSALDAQKRWDAVESALGSVPDSGHAWDDDHAAWVRGQRRADDRRTS